MIFDGLKFRRNSTYGWRHAKEGDVNADGKQLESNYIVIVKIKDCEIQEEECEGRILKFYSAENAPQAVKLRYSLTCMGSGSWRHRVLKHVRDVPGLGVMYKGDEYEECQVFLVHDGRVYTTNHKRRIEGTQTQQSPTDDDPRLKE